MAVAGAWATTVDLIAGGASLVCANTVNGRIARPNATAAVANGVQAMKFVLMSVSESSAGIRSGCGTRDLRSDARLIVSRSSDVNDDRGRACAKARCDETADVEDDGAPGATSVEAPASARLRFE